MAVVPKVPDDNGPAVMAIQVNGGTSTRLCAGYCFADWSTSGQFLAVELELASETSPGRALAIPVGPGESLPDLPPAGIAPNTQRGAVKGSQLIPRAYLVPGKNPERYGFVKTSVHRNLYRISLP